LQRVAACCSVLQRVAACCSVLQRVVACCSVLQRVLHYKDDRERRFMPVTRMNESCHTYE